MPWREKLLELSPEELVIVVLIVFVCIVFLKAYAIGIVWRCYKYLTLRQQSMRTLLPLGISDITSNNLGSGERAYSTLLPNYDEAVAAYMKQAPPPSYQVAMSNYPAEEQNNAPITNSEAVEEEDNNNDTSNNNNTVHVNNNTPPMRRNENVVPGRTVTGDEATPPRYSDVIIEPESPSEPSGTTAQIPNSSESHA